MEEIKQRLVQREKEGAIVVAPKSSLVAPSPSPFSQKYSMPPLVRTPYALNMCPKQMQVVPHLQEKNVLYCWIRI